MCPPFGTLQLGHNHFFRMRFLEDFRDVSRECRDRGGNLRRRALRLRMSYPDQQNRNNQQWRPESASPMAIRQSDSR